MSLALQLAAAGVSSLTYPGLSAGSTTTYPLNQAIASITPSLGSGSATSFTLNPSLPAGLALNSTTGQLTGTPTVAFSSQTYTITATDAASSTSATFSFMLATGLYRG